MNMASETPIHVLLVSFPAQGHVNPLLRLGKRLASKGLLVTFSTTHSFGIEMKKANSITEEPIPVGKGFVRFEFFDDGWDEDDPRRTDLKSILPQIEFSGKVAVSNMVKKHEHEGHRISCIINNPFVPWVCDVAAELNIPCAVLWVQSCAVFSAYYHYLHELVPFPTETEPNLDVQLPCMPLLKHDEIPSFLHPSTPYPELRSCILDQFRNIDKAFSILIDTVYGLERDIIDYMSNIYPIKPIGPLFRYPEETNSACRIRGDLMKADECIEWLNSKDASSVVYISFGTVVYLSQEQVDEIAHGLLSSGMSFLWVMKPPLKVFNRKDHTLPDGFLEKVGDKGKIVQWSPQEEVLGHPSVACFLTHCGWNSTLETLACGVPVVTFPEWGDQVTDAKFLVDVFGVGIRLRTDMSGDKLVTRDVVEKCLQQATKGSKAKEIKENARKWKNVAEAAVAVGGSSDRNIQEFIEEVKMKMC